MIIRAPGVTSAESVCDTPVVSMDFYPTILELAGIDQMTEQHVDGLSLKPILSGKDSLDRKSLFWHYPHYHGSEWIPGSAIREGDWKLIRFYEDDKIELYNLKDDLGEKYDLAEVYPEKLLELNAKLNDYMKECDAKMPYKNPQLGGVKK